MGVIRVLQVFTIMDRGGAESMIMNYYRKIDKTKVQFDFLVHRQQKGAFDDEIESLGGKIYRLNPISPFFPKSYYNDLRAFFKKHNHYKIIHSHLNTFSCFPLKIAQEFSIPCRIAHAHIAIDDVTIGSFFSGKESIKETLKKAVKLQLKKKIHKYSTHRFSCGEKAGKWLFGAHTKFMMMNNAVDAQTFAYTEEISASYKKDLAIENKLVIGHVGRFSSQKNHSFLLKIFAALLKKNKDCKLVLVGDGPLRSKIEAEAKELSIFEQILFLGVRTDIPQLYQMLDIFVFPSFYEGLPVTLIEAQSAGLKVFASDTITSEVHLTDDIQFLSIEKPAAFWAEQILKIENINKSDNINRIIEGNYDIISNTKNIEHFYLQQLAV